MASGELNAAERQEEGSVELPAPSGWKKKAWSYCSCVISNEFIKAELHARKVYHSVCDEVMANWEELPQELLKLIFQRLAIEDFLAFGAVCTSWPSAATKETYDTKSKAPWLVTNVYKQMPEFCSPSRERIYPVESLGTRAQTLSLREWMLLSNWDHEYCIFNPVSRVSIELPAMKHLFSKSFIGLKPLRVTIELPAMEQIFRESFLSLEQQVQRINKIAVVLKPFSMQELRCHDRLSFRF